MLMAIVDTETTGDDELAQVMDLAIVTVSAISPYPEVGRWSTLVRPTVPCAIEARATHHITDAMVAEAWTFEEMMQRRGLEEFAGEEVLLVAHNLEFDRRMLVQSLGAGGRDDAALPRRGICTYRCARHVWPEAPRHSNQVLRYWLDLDAKADMDLASLPPHRALPDAVVTSRILMMLLRERTAEELVTLTTQPFLIPTCNLPKHRDKPWAEVARVDPSYMRWMLSQGSKRKDPATGKDTGFDEDTRYTLMHHLGML